MNILIGLLYCAGIGLFWRLFGLWCVKGFEDILEDIGTASGKAAARELKLARGIPARKPPAIGSGSAQPSGMWAAAQRAYWREESPRTDPAPARPWSVGSPE